MAPKEYIHVVVDEEGAPIEAYKNAKDAKAAAGEGSVQKIELKAAGAAEKPAKRAAKKESADAEDAPAKKKPKTTKASTETVPEGKPGAFDGLKMLFTGSMTLSRPTMEAAAVKCGATIVKKLDDTDFIILGTKPGPKKVSEIEEKSLRTINVEEFMDFLETGEEPE